MERRGALRAVDGGEWPSAFAALAKACGCEVDAAAPQHAERALDYLLEQAVALDYRDNKEDLGGVVQAGEHTPSLTVCK